MTVVSGWRATAAGRTNRPLMADRPPVALLPTVWVTVVAGCRATVEAFTNRPVMADLLTLRAMIFSLAQSRPSGHSRSTVRHDCDI